VQSYRQAFDAFLSCAQGDAPGGCASLWTKSVQPLLERGGYDSRDAEQTADYYVDLLKHGNLGRYCQPANA
jgi:hypothetical protein